MLKEIFVLSLMLIIPLSANAQIIGNGTDNVTVDNPFNITIVEGQRGCTCTSIDEMFVSNDVGNSYVRMIGTTPYQNETITFVFYDSSQNVIDQYTHVTNHDGSYEAIWRILDYLPDGIYYVELADQVRQFDWKSIKQFTPSISIESTTVDEPIEFVTESSDIEILDLRLRILQVLESIFKIILG